MPYTPEQMFDLVVDVEQYPHFLPWVEGVRVFKRQGNVFYADLVVGFRVFTERFTSKVWTERPHAIQVDYIKGPLKYLHNEWYFEPAEDGGTLVDFEVDFEFKSRIFQRLAGALFNEALHRMVRAFEKRAEQIYG